MFPLFSTIHIICQVVNCDLSMQKCVKTNLILYSHFFFLLLIKMYIIFTAAAEEAQFGELNCAQVIQIQLKNQIQTQLTILALLRLFFNLIVVEEEEIDEAGNMHFSEAPYFTAEEAEAAENGDRRRARGIRGTQQHTTGSYTLDRS